MKNGLIFLAFCFGLACLNPDNFKTFASNDNFNTDCIDNEVVKKTDWQLFKEAAQDTAKQLKKDLGFVSMSDLQFYDGLMKVFFIECKFKGAAKNPISGATGLIQFMPSTLRRLDVPKNIGKLSEIEQLHYVSKYFRHKAKEHRFNAKQIDSFVDIYMIVFAPAFADKPDWQTVYSCKSYKDCKKKKRKNCAYHANRGYDVNKDGKILKAEIRDYILNKHYRKK